MSILNKVLNHFYEQHSIQYTVLESVYKDALLFEF